MVKDVRVRADPGAAAAVTADAVAARTRKRADEAGTEVSSSESEEESDEEEDDEDDDDDELEEDEELSTSLESTSSDEGRFARLNEWPLSAPPVRLAWPSSVFTAALGREARRGKRLPHISHADAEEGFRNVHWGHSRSVNATGGAASTSSRGGRLPESTNDGGKR
jgi:hypothetical protein